jgi:hypothetical protein
MRWVVAVLVVVAATLAMAAIAGSAERLPRRSLGGGISAELPHGWHLIRAGTWPKRGRPVPLKPAVLASFRVVYGRHPCPCATPNYRSCGGWCEEPSVRNFPLTGVLVYVWQFAVPRNPALLGRGFALHHPRFQVVQRDQQFARAVSRELGSRHLKAGHVCVEGPGSHPSWWSDFKERGRAFQVEVYLGPGVRQADLARADSLLDSLDIAAAPTSQQPASHVQQ